VKTPVCCVSSFFDLELSKKGQDSSEVEVKIYHFDNSEDYLNIKYVQNYTQIEQFKVNGITWNRYDHKYSPFSYTVRDDTFSVRGKVYDPLYQVSSADPDILKLIRFIPQNSAVPVLGLYPDGPLPQAQFDASSNASRAYYFEQIRTALKSYREKNGKYPQFLNDMVPEFIPINPKDSALQNRCDLYSYYRISDLPEPSSGFMLVVPFTSENSLECSSVDEEYTCSESSSYEMVDPYRPVSIIQDAGGNSYVANQILILLADETTKNDVEELANQLEACITGYIPNLALISLSVDAPTSESITVLIKQVKDMNNPLIQEVIPNFVSGF